MGCSTGRRFPFSAVIFDMDGVLVDTEAFYKEETRAFAAHLGLEVSEEELNAQVGASHQDFLRMLVDWHARAGQAVSPGEGLRRYLDWRRGNPPIDYRSLLNPGVRETLDELHRRGVRTALASSSPMASIRTVLAACGLTGLFEAVVSGEQFRQSKPDPEIYLHTLEVLGLPARACCCVEDSVPGITAGKAAGLTVFAKREERFGFSQEAADRIIDQIPDLLAITERPR